MVEFSTSALIDGLIQLVAFLLACVGLRFIAGICAKGRYERHFLRTVVVLAAFVTTRVYLLNHFEWARAIGIQLVLLGALVFLLVLVLIRPPMGVAPLIATVAVAFGFIAEKRAAAISAKVSPAGPTFAEYMGLAQKAIERNKGLESSDSSGLDLKTVVREGLDALATLTEEGEVDAMKEDFSYGMDLFAKRKAWTDSLTPEEKQAYREQMSAFLAEQGIAEDRYSLSAIQKVEPANLAALADFFEESRDEHEGEEREVRSISESIATLSANLRGLEIADKDRETLGRFVELFGQDDMERAIAEARSELEAAGGDNAFLATALAAMTQSKSGLPLDRMLAEDRENGGGGFDLVSLKAMASRFWSREGEDPEQQWKTFGPTGTVVEVTEVVGSEAALDAIPPPPDPFVHVTTRFGVALVPREAEDMHGWIAAAQQIEMKGYVSLGDEIVILRTDGVMMRKGAVWPVESEGKRYHFRIDEIMRDRVVLRAEDGAPGN